MKENGIWIKEKEKVIMIFQIKADFMESGEMIKYVALELYSMQMKINMKGIFLTISHMVKENIIFQMETTTKEDSKKEDLKDKAITFIRMVLNMKVSGKMD